MTPPYDPMQSLRNNIQKWQSLAKQRGQQLYNESKHVLEQGGEAARGSWAEGQGTQLSAEAHQKGLESADTVLELTKEAQEQMQKNQRGQQRGQRGGQRGGGGQQGGQTPNTQGGSGQNTGSGLPQTGNPPSTYHPGMIPGAKVPPTDPGVLQQTMEQSMKILEGHAQTAQQFVQSQAGNAGAAASTSYTAARYMVRRPPPGMVLNGYVVAVAAIIALIYLSWVFAAALSNVTDENAKLREELEKAREKALLEYASRGGPPPGFGKLNSIPRKAGG